MNVSSPKCNRLGRRNQLKRKDCKPGQSIFPTAGESPSGINKADDVGVKGTVDGIQNGHFCQSQVGEEQHAAHDEICNIVLGSVVKSMRRFRTFSYSLDGMISFDLNSTIVGLLTNNQSRRTTLAKGATRTNKETSTDSTSDGNHLHVSVLQATMQLVLLRRRAAMLLIMRVGDCGLILDFFQRR